MLYLKIFLAVIAFFILLFYMILHHFKLGNATILSDYGNLEIFWNGFSGYITGSSFLQEREVITRFYSIIFCFIAIIPLLRNINLPAMIALAAGLATEYAFFYSMHFFEEAFSIDILPHTASYTYWDGQAGQQINMLSPYLFYILAFFLLLWKPRHKSACAKAPAKKIPSAPNAAPEGNSIAQP